MSIRLRPEGETTDARDLAVVQIAGLVARRIVCDLRQGESVRGGARFGIIRFGSRVDVFLPPGTEILVQAGITTRGGETVLARFV
jgi:phosphatidylserine decarboxylase